MADRKDFNLGNDVSIVVNGPFGRIDIGLVTSFKCKQLFEKSKVNPLNSPPLEKRVPMGWEGSFEVERSSSAFDDLASLLESSFNGTGRIGTGTMTIFIGEIDGSTSTFLGEGLAISTEDAGSWERGKSVKQTYDFFLSTRRKIG